MGHYWSEMGGDDNYVPVLSNANKIKLLNEEVAKLKEEINNLKDQKGEEISSVLDKLREQDILIKAQTNEICKIKGFLNIK